MAARSLSPQEGGSIGEDRGGGGIGAGGSWPWMMTSGPRRHSTMQSSAKVPAVGSGLVRTGKGRIDGTEVLVAKV